MLKKYEYQMIQIHEKYVLLYRNPNNQKTNFYEKKLLHTHYQDTTDSH